MTTARFTIARGALLPALTAVNRAVEKRNTIPILGNVLLRAEGGTLFVTGTNLDVEVKAPAKEIGVPDFEPFTVPSGMLHDAVGKMAESAEIAFEGDGNFVNVKSGRTRFRLQFLPATDFPVLPADSFTHSFSLPAKVLAHIVATVSFAISTEETRYYLNGIHLHHDGTYLAAVATDGHRLALVTLDPPAGSKDMPGIIVPRSTVSLISHFVKGDGDIGIELSSQKIRFTLSDGTTITSKLIDGTFPDYRRVIPSSNDKTYVLDRAALAAAIDRVSTVSKERGRAVREQRLGLRERVGVDQEDGALRPRCAAGDEHALHDGGRLVQHRRIGGRQARQIGDHRLEVDEGFEPTLRDLRLVGRVRGVPGRVLEDVARDHRRGQRVVVAQPDHRPRRPVLRRELAQLRERLRLGRRRGDGAVGDGGGMDGCRDGAVHERADAVVAERAEHLGLGGGVGADVPVAEGRRVHSSPPVSAT